VRRHYHASCIPDHNSEGIRFSETMNKRIALFLSLAMLGSRLATGASAVRPNSAGRGAKEKAAQKACLTGDVKAGIEILADLYVQTGDAVYVFNQGRCNEQNHRWQEALDMFREYLRKAPYAPKRVKANTTAHIAQCQTLLAEQKAAAGPVLKNAPGPESPVVVAPLPQPPTVAPSPPVGVATAAATPPDGRGLRSAGALTAAAGLCAVAVGIALNIKERSLTNEINTKFSQSKESSRASYQAWSYASYGLGTAALLTGATLYYFGWHTGEDRALNRRVALVPTLTSNAMTFVVHGRF